MSGAATLVSAAEILLTSDSLQNGEPHISSDGEWVVYTKKVINILDYDYGETVSSQIYKVPFSGGNEVRLSPDTTGSYEWARWSPDGNWVVCIKLEFPDTATEILTDLYRIPSSGSTEVKLTNTGNTWNVGYPEWSPDGNWIAYHKGDSTADGIWKVPSSGGTEFEIASDTFNYGSIDWSPDGNWIAYSKGTDQVYGQIYKVSSGGGTENQLTSSDFPHTVSRWSSDGNWILYSKLDSTGVWQIYKIDPDEGVEIPLTTGSIHLSSYYVSPDGNWVTYLKIDPVTAFQQIHIRLLAGGPETPLTNGNFNHMFPQWSPDGNWIFYVGNHTGGVGTTINWQIYKVAGSGN